MVRVDLKRADAAELVHEDVVLASSALVRALGPRAPAVLSQGVVRRYADRVVIFQRGEEGSSLYLVLAGEVRLLARRDADSVELDLVEKGDVFGEDEALVGAPIRGASALAHGEVDLVELPRRALLLQGRLPAELGRMLEGVRRARQRTLDEMTEFLNRW